MNKIMVISVITAITLFLTLPILINLILSIDWFKTLVVGEEDAWLSFYGSYLGGVLGGILTLFGVVMTIRYQDKLRKKEIEESENINIRVIDNIIERAFGSLFYFTTWFLAEEKYSRQHIEMFRTELIKYKRASKDVHDIPLKLIPAKFFGEYTHNRDLIGIIEVELADVLENNRISDYEIEKRLKDMKILGRIKWIIINHLKFIPDEKRKEERVALLKEFNELKKATRVD